MHAMWAFQIAKAVCRVPGIAVHAQNTPSSFFPQLWGSTVCQPALLRQCCHAPPVLSASVLPQAIALKHEADLRQPASPQWDYPLISAEQLTKRGFFCARKPVLEIAIKVTHQLSSGPLQAYPASNTTNSSLLQLEWETFYPQVALNSVVKSRCRPRIRYPLQIGAPGLQHIRCFSEQPPPCLEHHAAHPVSPVTSVGVNPQLDPTLAQAVCGATEKANNAGEKKQMSFLGRLRASLTRNQLLGLGHLASLFGVIALFMKVGATLECSKSFFC